MKMKSVLTSLLACVLVAGTMATAAFADGETTKVALISGEDRYVDDLQSAFTAAENPNMKQVLMATDWKGDIDINYPGFASSFYVNGYTLDGCLKLTDISILNLYGIEPGNDWAGSASVITNGIYQYSSANVNVNGDITVQPGDEGYSLIATAGKMIVNSDNVTFTDDIKVQGEAILKITAGTYNGKFEIDTPTNLEITGGTFAGDPSAYLPTGFTAVKGADDKYTIQAPTGSLDDLTLNAEGKYVLSTPTDVVRFRTVMSKQSIAAGTEFVLANDIDMAGVTLAPAGNDTMRFSGIFDGQNHKISNVTIEGGNDTYVAFFGNTSGATIKNLTLENVTVKGGEYTAGIVGRTRNTTVTNCHVTGKIDISGTVSVGAIAGGGVTNITESSVVGTEGSSITGQAQVGAVTGLSSAGTTNVDNNSAKGVEVEATKGYAGGIVGNALVNKDGISLSISGNVVEEVEVVSGDDYSSAVIVGSTRTDGKGVVSYTDNATKESTVEVDGVVSSDMYGGAEDDENITIPVAKIGTAYFNTLKEAVAAITDNTTITLIAEVKDETVKLPAVLNNFTLDANGMTVKNTVINASDGSSVEYRGFNVVNGIFDNSRFVLGGQRGGTVIYEDVVFNNNKFLNIVASGNMAAVHMNVNAGENEYIRNFTFTNNVIDGVSGSSNSGIIIKSVDGDILISGNTITNVAWNAIQCWFSRDNAEIVIEDNTLASGAEEGVLNLNGITSATLRNNTITLNEGQAEIGYFVPVAKIGDKLFTSLDAAISDADDDDTITLITDAKLASANIKKDIVIDLNKNELNVNAVGIMDHASGATAAIQAWADVTVKNGTVNVTSAARIANGIFYISGKAGSRLAFEDVIINAENTNGSDLIVTCSAGDLEITDSVINAKDVSKLINGGDTGSAEITGTEINLSDSERAMVNVALTATDSEISISNLSDNALRNVSGTIHNTNIDAKGYKNGIKNDAGLGLVVSGDSNITMTGAQDSAYDIVLADGASVKVTDTAVVSVDKTKTAENGGFEGNVISKAEIVYVQFKKTDLDDQNKDNDELKDVYELILAGYDAETINELASADITFKFEPTPVKGGKMAYDVIAENGVTASRLGESDRFMFNYNGIDKYEETGKAIKIATIEVSGYGTYNLGTDTTVDTNAVYATEIRDNKVDGFVPAADTLRLNLDMVENDGMVGEITATEILVPTRELKINIDFPNEATTNNKVAYQQMTVTVSGGDLEEAMVIKLGDVAQITDLEKFAAKKSDKKAVSAVATKDAYDITITDLLTLSVAYNVTVEGVGYRTARHTVTMTDNKELFFWNNVKDNATVVEEGKKTADVTFLAGDIVKDNNINIYDLSAVVSYFGESGLGVDKRPEYAKYDLNRDGKIDTKDVAYVLVSWGK